MSFNIDYQPVERSGHSTVIVGDNLYMWGGDRYSFPRVHESEWKRSLTSYVEVLSLNSGKWTRKQTTGNPPPGISGYSSVAIDNDIFYFGGNCGHYDCYHNSLYSLNVDTLKWREHSPSTTASGHPSKKSCGMVHVQLDEEDYLVLFGGKCPCDDNTPHQSGAQYSSDGFTNEVHYYCISSGMRILYVIPLIIYAICFTGILRFLL